MVPALAVAAALRADGAEVAFVGAGRAEARLVPQAGYELHAISVEGLSRRNPLLALRAVLRAALAVARARSLLRRLRPDAVMGGGGYVSGPVALAALTLGIPVVLSEADSRLGLTNRLLAPFARRVFLAFAIGGREGERYRVTGRPVPAPSRDLEGARERLGIGAEETCVLVFGGSLGARTINRASVDAFAGRPSIGGAFRVLHIAGSREYDELSARELPGGYDLREYLEEADFADALAAADLVVSRAGGSLFEIAAHGAPAILVPYPHAAADHQTTNARWMADAGAALVIPDRELSGARLARQVAELLADPSGLAAMAAASRGLARPDAAYEVARELLEVARG
ncbi:MAG: UDP-N-acetylglucosamine--N-acetylmuramyl-(pentapeptide) pyrophosphoryl-undecaprenol [Solirubrobacteraceae bacterium]|nr:UDP-N-acetylglucosamine--N-acetylmuramyl-(pentapeptide) pyrophosphoryl-undecaprenol [Solirubrobacteraceae bacterium]